MLTSGLKALSELWGHNIKVFFETPIVKELYVDCPFMNALDNRPHGRAFASTMFSSWGHGDYRKKKSHPQESLQECFFRLYAVQAGYTGDMPHTYVDLPNDGIKLKKKDGKKYIAVFHGCLGEHFRHKKSIPMSSLQFLIDRIVEMGHVPVLLGSKGDVKKYWKAIKTRKAKAINHLGRLTLRNTASVLSQCDSFVSNDTGLYHVAAAYKMKGMVLWNKTEFYKNAPSFDEIERVQLGGRDASVYNNAISNYLEKLK